MALVDEAWQEIAGTGLHDDRVAPAAVPDHQRLYQVTSPVPSR
jgi:hypothetical protein